MAHTHTTKLSALCSCAFRSTREIRVFRKLSNEQMNECKRLRTDVAYIHNIIRCETYDTYRTDGREKKVMERRGTCGLGRVLGCVSKFVPHSRQMCEWARRLLTTTTNRRKKWIKISEKKHTQNTAQAFQLTYGPIFSWSFFCPWPPPPSRCHLISSSRPNGKTCFSNEIWWPE